MNISYVGQGKVELIASPGRVLTDIAARFTRSEGSLQEILTSDYNGDLVSRLVDMNHLHTTNFDWFVFGVEGYSRVCEVQLVRKNHASFMVKSGRPDKGGKRSFDVVLPNKKINDCAACIKIDPTFIVVNESVPLLHFLDMATLETIELIFTAEDLLKMSEQLYNDNLQNFAEEDLRYLKPQATEFKAMIGMSAHALLDFFAVRCCQNAQAEIQDMAWKMLKICQDIAPDIFKEAGPACYKWGCCPENDNQNVACKGKMTVNEWKRRIIQIGGKEDETFR